jgi:hypothetical protein
MSEATRNYRTTLYDEDGTFLRVDQCASDSSEPDADPMNWAEALVRGWFETGTIVVHDAETERYVCTVEIWKGRIAIHHSAENRDAKRRDDEARQVEIA